MVIDISGESKRNGATLIQYRFHGAENQRWKFDYVKWLRKRESIVNFDYGMMLFSCIIVLSLLFSFAYFLKCSADNYVYLIVDLWLTKFLFKLIPRPHLTRGFNFQLPNKSISTFKSGHIETAMFDEQKHCDWYHNFLCVIFYKIHFFIFQGLMTYTILY